MDAELQILCFRSPRPCASSPDLLVHLVHLVLALVLGFLDVLGVLGLELVVKRCSGG